MSSVVSSKDRYGCLEIIKDVGFLVGGALAVIVIAVAHPIIGPLGSLGGLFATAYHGILLNYHWRHTAERKDGQLMPGTELGRSTKNYMYENTQFDSADLVRLQNEKKRLYHLEGVKDSLKWARGFAKFSVPLAGPLWAIFSEVQKDGSIQLEDDGQLRPQQMLDRHIAKLTQTNVQLPN